MAENKKIRIGNDIRIEWTLLDGDSQPYILTGRDISIEVVIGMKKARIKEFSVNENVVSFTYFGKDQKYTGNCDLKFIENDGEREMVTFDIQSAFALVSHSWEAVDAGETPETIQLEFVTVTSELVERVGPKGDTGDPAGFGEVTAEVDGNVGTPSVSVETSGPDTAKNFHFAFSNLKGNKGEKGDTPVLTADDDGTIYADGEVLTEVIKEAKETADDDHTRAESDSENAHLDSERAGDDRARATDDHERYINDHDTAGEDHTQASRDHTTATTDHTRAGQDHTQAVSNHDTATSDHATATADHTRAEQDHAQAVSDHDTADSDHILAVEDHSTAGEDHTQAVSDHDIATSDHSTASSDHTTAASDHAQAETDHSTAGTDHTRAESDHSTASDDHSTAASDHSRAESDHERAEDDHESIADKADVDGWYSGMTVGLAENLIDTRGEGTDQEFLFRKSCGDKSITDRGNALIQSIYGKTVAWNQLLQNGDFSDGTTGWSATNATMVVDNGVCTFTPTGTYGLIHHRVNIINGHLYYFAATINTAGTVRLQVRNATKSTAPCDYFAPANGRNSTIFTATGVEPTDTVVIRIVENNTAGYPAVSVDNIILIDLTLLTGITTVAEFEKFYNRPYYAFNAGTLLSNKASAIESVGFNQYNPTTGKASVIKGQTYYVGGTYIALAYSDGTAITVTSNLFTADRTDEVTVTGGNATDTIINLSDPAKNGTYEPYTLTTLRLDLTTLTGKLNGEGESVVIAPEGLAGNGDWADQGIVENGYLTKIVKNTPRVAVDLGDYNWLYSSVTHRFYVTGVTGFAPIAGNVVANLVCARYLPDSNANTYANINDKRISYYDGMLAVYDSGAGTDTTAFKTAVTGVKLIYQLDTPQVYVLDTPIPITYAVENGGTERIIPDGVDEQGVPATAPFNAKILYSTNFPREIANLPQNYISKESAVNLLEALKSAGVISAYTMTFVNGVYTFTITA